MTLIKRKESQYETLQESVSTYKAVRAYRDVEEQASAVVIQATVQEATVKSELCPQFCL